MQLDPVLGGIGGGWPQWAWSGAQSSTALPAWGGGGPGLGIGSTAKKALMNLLGGVCGWPPQAVGDGDPRELVTKDPGNLQGHGSGAPATRAFHLQFGERISASL